MNIDLTKFSLQSEIVHPYLKITKDDTQFHFFEGAIGNNRFRYFRIPSNSRVGELFSIFYEKYFVRIEVSHQYYKECQNVILEASKDPSIQKEEGLDAFYLYWLSIVKEEKAKMHFVLIPHYEALKEWFNYALDYYIKSIKDKIVDFETEKIETQRWKSQLIKEIEESYLLVSDKTRDRIPVISSIHAKELHLFYEWLTTGKDGICTVPSIEKIIAENGTISNDILDAYYALVDQPKSVDELPYKNYFGRLNRFNKPFPNITYYGAYVFGPVLDDLHFKMKNVNDEMRYFRFYTKKSVFSALKEYAKGFQFGFDNFMQDKINKPTILVKDEDHKIRAIYDYVSINQSHMGLSESYGNGEAKIFSNWYDDGNNAGYFYCAWFYIFENHRTFERFFSDEIISTDKDKSANLNETTQHWKDIIKVELHNRLETIENSILEKIARWKQRKDLIECASFCQLLYEKKFFEQGSTSRKSVNSFALSKYGTDIQIQLGSSKKEGRAKHKKFFLKYFK